MISYTIEDYFKLKNFFTTRLNYLKEDTEEYKVITKAKHHKHDKLFREILNNKKEIVKLINKYITPQTKITEEKIEKYDTKYITKGHEERQADVVYKIKEKEVYFLIEHQTKVDELMAYRILEYSIEIIRTKLVEMIESKRKGKIPRIIPIVIYTGQREWKAKRTVEEIQVEFEHLKGIDVITGYKLVDIRDEKEAIEEGTAVARMSVIERMKDTEEIIEVVKKMSKYIKEKEERKEFAREIKYLLEDKLTKEEIRKIEEILIEREGEEGMLHAQMVIRRDFERAKEEGRREGMLHAQEVIRRDFERAKEEGRKEGMLHAQEVIRRDFERAKEKGRRENAIEVAKNMLKENFDVDLISRLTGLKKEQFMQ